MNNRFGLASPKPEGGCAYFGVVDKASMIDLTGTVIVFEGKIYSRKEFAIKLIKTRQYYTGNQYE